MRVGRDEEREKERKETGVEVEREGKLVRVRRRM